MSTSDPTAEITTLLGDLAALREVAGTAVDGRLRGVLPRLREIREIAQRAADEAHLDARLAEIRALAPGERAAAALALESYAFERLLRAADDTAIQIAVELIEHDESLRDRVLAILPDVARDRVLVELVAVPEFVRVELARAATPAAPEPEPIDARTLERLRAAGQLTPEVLRALVLERPQPVAEAPRPRRTADIRLVKPGEKRELDHATIARLRSVGLIKELRTTETRVSDGEWPVVTTYEVTRISPPECDESHSVPCWPGFSIDAAMAPIYTRSQWELLVELDGGLRDLVQSGAVVVSTLSEAEGKSHLLGQWRAVGSRRDALPPRTREPKSKATSGKRSRR